MRETQFGGLRRKEKRISAFRGCETPSPTKKRLRAALNFVVGEHCRSHSLAELRWKGHWCSCTCFSRTLLLRHPRASEGNCIIRFRVNFCCTIQNVLVDECQAVALENVIDVNPVDAVMHRWREEVDVSQFLDATCATSFC